MVQRYASLASLVLATGLASAQSPIELRDHDGVLVNGQLVEVVGGAEEFVLEESIIVTLASGDPVTVNVRRYELDVQPTTYNYFCWGQCYAPREAGQTVAWQGAGQDALELVVDVPNTNFHAYHMPSGLVGNSTYRYVWFNVTSFTDSVWCDIQFRAIDNVGVEELTPAVTLSAYPNPSQGSDIQFQMDVRNVDQALDLVVFNALGERVRTITVRPGQTLARLGTVNMSEGLYFASVQRNGDTLATKRFVVTGR
jgi:hypothetical protein